MSNPFAPTLPGLPNIQQGGTLQMPGIGDTLAQQVAGFIHARMVKQEMDQAQAEFQQKVLKEQQDIEESKARAKMLGLQGDEAAVRTKDLQQRIKAQEHKDDVERKAIQMLGGWQALGGGDLAAAQMHAVNKDPEVGNRFEELRRDQAKVAAELGGFRTDAAMAPVKAKLAGALDVATNDPATATRVALANQGLPQPTEQTVLGQKQDVLASKTREALTFFQTGVPTIQQAFAQQGLPVPPGMDPNAKFGGKPTAATLRGSLANSVAQQTAGAFAKDMIQQDITIKDFAEKTGGLSPLGRFAYDPTHNAWTASGANKLLSADQQSLLLAGTAFAQAWKKMIDGARAAPGDLKMTFNMAVPFGTDDPATKRQKDLMRQTMIQAIQGMSGQAATSRVPILQAYRDAAAQQGLGPDRLRFLDQAIKDAQRYESSAPPAQELPPAGAVGQFQKPPGM